MRQFEIEHGIYIINVEPPCCNVRRDQHVRAPVGEANQGLTALVLLHVTVQGHGAEPQRSS